MWLLSKQAFVFSLVIVVLRPSIEELSIILIFCFLLHLSFSGNQKGKRRGAQQAGGAGVKKGHDGKEKKPEKSSDKLTPNRTTGLSTQAQPFDTRTGAPSVISERSDSSDVTDDKKRLSIAKVQKHRQSSAIMNPPLIPQVEESKPPTEEEEREKELTKK